MHKIKFSLLLLLKKLGVGTPAFLISLNFQKHPTIGHIYLRTAVPHLHVAVNFGFAPFSRLFRINCENHPKS
jgi:hypothetical protein